MIKQQEKTVYDLKAYLLLYLRVYDWAGSYYLKKSYPLLVDMIEDSL